MFVSNYCILMLNTLVFEVPHIFLADATLAAGKHRSIKTLGFRPSHPLLDMSPRVGCKVAG